MELLSEYGLFLAKVITFLIAFVIVIGIITTSKKTEDNLLNQIKITHINDKINQYQYHLQKKILNADTFKNIEKKLKPEKKEKKKNTEQKHNLFLLQFKAGIDAKEVAQLKEEITALLTVATKEDEILINVESGGGMVHSYGLVASQVDRIKQANIPLTIAIDKVAASGGYMIASVADKIIAAPFAIVGSIGVLAQMPNFNKVLKKHDIDYEQHTAGEYKRTLTLFGENTDKQREKFQEDIQHTHDLFKSHIAQYRPHLNMDDVATGEYWYGKDALQKQLVDEIMTSDDYIMDKSKHMNIFLIELKKKKNLIQKFNQSMNSAIDNILLHIRERFNLYL